MVKKKAVKRVKKAVSGVKKAVKKKNSKKGPAKKGTAKKRQAGKVKALRSRVERLPDSTLEKIGEITHYFPHVNAAAVKLLKSGLRAGDKIYIKGHTSDFKEKVASIQLDHVPIIEGKKGQEIGLSVRSRVRAGDSVYKI